MERKSSLEIRTLDHSHPPSVRSPSQVKLFVSENWRQSLDKDFKTPTLREVWSYDSENSRYGLILANVGDVLIFGKDWEDAPLVLVDLKTKAVIKE